MTGLNNFTPVGGGNVAVGPTPLAIQVSGTTCVITNVGVVTVYGSLTTGSAAAGVSAGTFISGQPVGGSGGGNAATATGGVAIPTGQPGGTVALAIGGNSWLWLQTLAGQGVVNVACGA